MSGQLEKILVNEGDFVEPNQLLATIKVTSLEAQLKEAKAQQFEKAVVPSLPLEKIEGIKCYNVDEVSKLIEWM